MDNNGWLKYDNKTTAKDAALSEKETNTLSEISFAIRNEEEAIQGYYRLLHVITKQEEIDKINEIIADEKNHIEVLNKILEAHDGIRPAKS